MNRRSQRLWPNVLISIIVALALTIVPLPEALAVMRPSFVALVVIYWILNEPRRIGLVTAWLAGLLLDALHGVLLGQHALALTLIGFVTQQLHLRVRVFPMGQQVLTVFMLVAVYEFLLFWADGVSGLAANDWRRWLSVPTSAALWPLVSAAVAGLYQSRRRADHV